MSEKLASKNKGRGRSAKNRKNCFQAFATSAVVGFNDACKDKITAICDKIRHAHAIILTCLYDKKPEYLISFSSVLSANLIRLDFIFSIIKNYFVFLNKRLLTLIIEIYNFLDYEKNK